MDSDDGFAPAHFEGDLPMKYDVKVEWKDSSGEAIIAKYTSSIGRPTGTGAACLRIRVYPSITNSGGHRQEPKGIHTDVVEISTC